MKKRNLLVICAAAGLCIASVLFLVGSMGIYAEKSGGMEQIAAMTEGEPEDLVSQALLEEEESDQKGKTTIPDETLQALWEEKFAAYLTIDTTDDDYRGEFIKKALKNAQAGEDALENEAYYEDTYLSDTPELGLNPSEAGLIALKELNRLYPDDSLEDLKIDHLQVDSDIGINGEIYVEWVGSLDTGYEIFDEKYISYDFHIDAISGKITGFSKFRPYQKDVDYSAISWTDEEIIERAKELIETYRLADGEDLDWSDVELYNGTDEVADLPLELEEPEASLMVTNTLIFKKNGEKNFHFSMDFETGEIYSYIWLGRWAR